jgi:hypothetical protein
MDKEEAGQKTDLRREDAQFLREWEYRREHPYRARIKRIGRSMGIGSEEPVDVEPVQPTQIDPNLRPIAELCIPAYIDIQEDLDRRTKESFSGGNYNSALDTPPADRIALVEKVRVLPKDKRVFYYQISQVVLGITHYSGEEDRRIYTTEFRVDEHLNTAEINDMPEGRKRGYNWLVGQKDDSLERIGDYKDIEKIAEENEIAVSEYLEREGWTDIGFISAMDIDRQALLTLDDYDNKYPLDK